MRYRFHSESNLGLSFVQFLMILPTTCHVFRSAPRYCYLRIDVPLRLCSQLSYCYLRIDVPPRLRLAAAVCIFDEMLYVHPLR